LELAFDFVSNEEMVEVSMTMIVLLKRNIWLMTNEMPWIEKVSLEEHLFLISLGTLVVSEGNRMSYLLQRKLMKALTT
jgi:uncharacterized membrane protein (DUF441 family)